MDKGFSLFELLVAISLIAIVSAMALPHYISLRNGYLLRSAVFNVRSDLQRARSEALRHNTEVKVIFSDGGYSVSRKTIDPGGAEAWAKEFGRSYDAVSFDMDKTSFGDEDYAVFNSRGMLTGPKGEVVLGSGLGRASIYVDKTGRIRIS